MRKFSILAIALMIAAIPTFSQSFNGVIKAQVENGKAFNSKVSKVSLRLGEGDECLVSGTYANGGFTVTLPANPNGKCLSNISNYPDYYNVSNKNAKYLEITEIKGFSSNGSFVANLSLQEISVGNIEHYKDDSGRDQYEVNGMEYYVSFWYVDRDLTINASPDDGTYTNLNLRKGWNTVIHNSHFMTGNGGSSTGPTGNMKWLFLSNADYSAALKTHFSKGTLGASGKTRPIQMFFQQVSKYGNTYAIGGKSKTNAAEDTFGGALSVSEETKGGSCKSDENELKGSYDLTEKMSKTSGRFAGTFTACERNGKLTKASFKGDWIKHSTGNKTPCNFEL